MYTGGRGELPGSLAVPFLSYTEAAKATYGKKKAAVTTAGNLASNRIVVRQRRLEARQDCVEGSRGIGLRPTGYPKEQRQRVRNARWLYHHGFTGASFREAEAWTNLLAEVLFVSREILGIQRLPYNLARLCHHTS